MVEFWKEAEAAIAASAGGRTRFFNTAEFAWVEKIEAAWSAIRGEVDCMLGALERLPGFEEIQPDQRLLTTNDKRWKILPLYLHGHDLGGNQKRCPATVEVLKDIPGLKLAMFSIMQARKELPPHRGPYSGVLRYHLGLKIPQPATQCGISIAGEQANPPKLRKSCACR